MKRFEYQVVIDKWGTGGTVASASFDSVTIHHSAVQSNVAGYNAETRAKSYAKWHRDKGYPGIAYQFMIPYDDSDIIYVVNYVSGHTWHNANYEGNKKALAVLVDGNFEIENPSTKQLQKLKQLLDDLQNNWFSNNGWYKFEGNIQPANKGAVRTYSEGIKVPSLHYHNEVAQKGNGTACCGAKLKPYVVEYRDKAGNVTWGVPVDPPPTPTDPCKAYKDEITTLKREKTELENKLGKSQADLENEQEAHADTKKLLEATVKELADTKKQLDTAQGQIPTLKGEINRLQNELDIANTALNDCQNKDKTLCDWILNLFKKLLQWLQNRPSQPSSKP